MTQAFPTECRSSSRSPPLPPLQSPPDWQEILTYFRGSELQNYFMRVLEDNLKVS